jgi:hypothetical protein
MGGWGLSRGGVGRPGDQCCRSGGAGRVSEAEGEPVVVVVNDICIVDGGCADVVRSGMARLWDARGGGVGRCGPLLTCSVVLQVQGGSVDIPMSFSGRGGPSLDAVCITALTVVVAVVWEAICAVAGVAWVVVLVVFRIRGIDASREAQRPSSWFDTPFSFSSLWPCASPDL